LIGRKYLAILILASVGFLCALSYRALSPRIIEYRQYRSLSRLAEKGEPGYQRLLGEYFYEKGDFESALKWELRSAQGGDPLAQDFMGIYRSHGVNEHLKPVAPDYEKAREWFEKAAAQDYPSSQAALCEMYQRGLGVAPDQEVAYFWCSLAGSSDSPRYQKLSGDALDQESRLRVESRVAAWKDAHRKSR
jgi:TPR repeat protein